MCCQRILFRTGTPVASQNSQERAKGIAEAGVEVIFDNASVASRATVLVLACLPVHFASVAAEIRTHIRPGVAVFSCIAGTSVGRVSAVPLLF